MTMYRQLAIIALFGLSLGFQGCARVGGASPSHLGLAALAEDDTDAEPKAPSETPDAARHVSSNKVLGAMAFQKVTGRAVDPSRLSEGR